MSYGQSESLEKLTLKMPPLFCFGCLLVFRLDITTFKREINTQQLSPKVSSGLLAC